MKNAFSSTVLALLYYHSVYENATESHYMTTLLNQYEIDMPEKIIENVLFHLENAGYIAISHIAENLRGSKAVLTTRGMDHVEDNHYIIDLANEKYKTHSFDIICALIRSNLPRHDKNQI
jgi:hypothetical protein